MAKIKDFLNRHESKIILIFGLVLVAVISFEGGVLKGKTIQDNPLVIEKAPASVQISKQDLIDSADTTGAETAVSIKNSPAANPDCIFVGSKNSNIYHTPNCPWAKKIKPENIVCFKSADEAAARGYKPDTACVKQ